MGRVQGRVAFITGAARGQGRSHAVRLAQESADTIAVGLCRDIGTLNYSLAGPDDLKETVRLVEALDRRIMAAQADVRERDELAAALEQGIAELGRRRAGDRRRAVRAREVRNAGARRPGRSPDALHVSEARLDL